jgi:hypothetical protein
MKGYIENVSPGWRHALKRTVGPGSRIQLKDLYEQYGRKHDLKAGNEFVEWLRSIKLKDEKVWKVVYDVSSKKLKSNSKASGTSVVKDEKQKTVEVSDQGVFGVTPTVSTTKMEINDIVALSVRKAREVVPEITDIKLLKYAKQEANQRPGKDSLCNILRKRIQELETYH